MQATDTQITRLPDPDRVLYAVKLWRGNILVLTEAELQRGLTRGKQYRRAQLHAARAMRRAREEARHA